MKMKIILGCFLFGKNVKTVFINKIYLTYDTYSVTIEIYIV